MTPRWRALALATATAIVPGAAAAEDWLPPVKASGAVTYSVQESKQGDGARSLQHAGTVTLNPSTYIYEPWFAQTNGSINLSKATTSGDTGSSTNVLTGSVNLSVLPQSNYPFEINYMRYNRDIQLGEDYNELTGQSVKLQSMLHLPDDWSVNSRAYADQSTDADGLGEVSAELGMEVDKRFAEDQVRVGYLHRESAYTGFGGTLDGVAANDSISVRHRSHPFETVTTDSTSTLRIANYTERNYSEESSVMQGVTTALWRPNEVKDLAVHGALRTFRQNATLTRTGTTTETTTRDSQTAFGTLATSYVFQPRLVGNVGLNAGYATSDDTSTGTADSDDAAAADTDALSLGGSGGLDYSSLATDISGFNWSWNTGGTLETATSNDLGLTHTEALRLGHTANRVLDLWVTDEVNFSASQNTGMAFTSNVGAWVPLSHSVTFSQHTREGKMWNFWHLSGSDSRTVGGVPATYQLLNLQITEGYDPDRFSSWSASIAFQAARQALTGTDTGFVDTVNGQLTYRQRHVFGVENLNFTSDITINPPSVIKRNRQQDLVSMSESREASGFGTQRWTNRLDYIIGQLRTGVTARVSRDEEGMSEMVLYQISRRF